MLKYANLCLMFVHFMIDNFTKKRTLIAYRGLRDIEVVTMITRDMIWLFVPRPVS